MMITVPWLSGVGSGAYPVRPARKEAFFLWDPGGLTLFFGGGAGCSSSSDIPAWIHSNDCTDQINPVCPVLLCILEKNSFSFFIEDNRKDPPPPFPYGSTWTPFWWSFVGGFFCALFSLLLATSRWSLKRHHIPVPPPPFQTRRRPALLLFL